MADDSVPPAPPSDLFYVVRRPWQWVMEEIKEEGMREGEESTELPSAKQPAIMTPQTSARRGSRRFRRDPTLHPSTMKLERIDPATGDVVWAVHGTSSALDGMGDKDELVRTLQRCRCEEEHICPPSVLLSWDVTYDECCNVVGEELPVLPTNPNGFAVLKEPMGSQGRGIFFVRTADEIHSVIHEHHEKAMKESEVLDKLIANKGRIPSWGECIVVVLVAHRLRYLLVSHTSSPSSRGPSGSVGPRRSKIPHS